VKKVEKRQILIRFRVSRSMRLEMKVRALEAGILVKRDTTLKLTMMS